VLDMVSGEYPFEMAVPPRSLVLWDRPTGRLTAGRSTASLSALCVGTIPDSSDYEVVIASNKKRVGTLEATFVDDNLRDGDVFVLGSSAWKVVGTYRSRLLVAEAPGATPTVPWWLGPIESRTPEAGERVGLLRRQIADRLSDPSLNTWLQQEYCSARTRQSRCQATCVNNWRRSARCRTISTSWSRHGATSWVDST